MIRRAATSAAVRVSSMLAAASKSRISDCSIQREPTRPFLYRDVNLIAGRPFPLDCSRKVKYTAFERSSSLQSSSSTINIMDDDNDNDHKQQPTLFLYYTTRGNRLLTPISLQDDGSLSAAKYPISPPFEVKNGIICSEKGGIYCSDGVFCYPVGDDEVFVWNPTTSETRKLPDSPFTPAPGVTKADILTATWADPKSEDYKVIRFFSLFSEGFEVRRSVEIEVYSLKSDSWKKMIEEELPLPLCENDLLVRVYDYCYTNGVIHIAYQVERPVSLANFILSFDFRSETFSTSPVPRSATFYLSHLVNYNGQPSILSITDRVNRDDLRTVPHYVMRKNGEWDIVGEYLVNCYYDPLGFARNGELLLLELNHLDLEFYLIRTKVGVFDSTTGEFKHLPGISSFSLCPGISSFALYPFHETFVHKLKPASSGEQGGTEDNGLTTEAVI